MVKVFVPQLPRAAALLPYLERIDATRQYANRGPLVVLFEQRLRAMLGLRHALPVMAASGTAALQAAILAHAGRATAARPLALVPAYSSRRRRMRWRRAGMRRASSIARRTAGR